MLNMSEIKSLEIRWRRYKRKKYVKLVTVLSFIFFSIAAFYFLKYYNFDNLKKDINNTNNSIIKKTVEKDANKSIDKKIISVAENMPKKSDESKLKKIQNKEFVGKKENNNTHLKPTGKIAKVSKRKQVQNKNVLYLNTSFLKQIYKKNDSENNKTLLVAKDNSDGIKNVKKSIKTVSSVSLQTEKKDITKNDEVKKKLVEVESPKPKVIISSQKIDRIKYLKKRYSETRKAEYAIMLSKDYYDKHNYKESLKWAIISNNSDNNDKVSWILFAKNKIKLGRTNEAINALRAYLRVNKSKDVEAFLNSIENGAFR